MSLALALDITRQCCTLALEVADLSTCIRSEVEHYVLESTGACDQPRSEDLLHEGIAILSASCRGFMEILGVATRGVIEAAHDRFALAEAHLEHAKRLAEAQAKVASSSILVEVLDGMLELTCARRAQVAGQAAAAQEHHRRSRQCFARLSELREAKRSRAACLVGSAVSRTAGVNSDKTPLAEARALATSESAADLEVAPNGMWFRVRGGERVNMRRRHAMRRLLLHLVEQLRAGARQAVPMSTLLEVGWPNERILTGAAMNRLYNAVAVLRRLGLGDMLSTVEGGYALDPSISVSSYPAEV
ncbi:MAG TPA: hypothetical protein VNO30_09005 [Kofleriaceae bacterium]|nr:hypothetical protein [Kofleriaceae bacterium]